MFKKVSIIIPVFNEDRYLHALLTTVIKAPVCKLYKEIIVINDGSTDRTSDILEKWQKKRLKNLYIFSQRKNKGKGSALRLGFKKSKGDLIIIQDADLEYHPKHYPALLRPFLKNNAQVVYGSRTLGIKIYHNKYSGVLFYLGGRLLTFILNFLFGENLTDQATGYKLFTKKVKKIILKNTVENDFSFEVEITALLSKNKIPIVEIPISYRPRNVSEGKKIKLRDFFKAISVALRFKIFSKN